VRSIRVFKNVVTNYLRFIMGGLIGLVITPIMVHVMGDGSYGLWVTVFSFTGYFGLFDQGIRPSLVRYISRDHARDDREGLERTVNTAIALFTVVGLIALGVTAVVAARFVHWFHIDPANARVASTVVLVAGGSVAVGFPLGVYGAVLSGLQRYDLGNGIGIAVAIVRALAFVAVLRLGGGLVGLAWASLAMSLIGYLLSWIAVRRLLPGLRYGLRFVTRDHVSLIGSYGGIAILGALATSITFQTDALVITAFMSAAAVTPFALAAGLVENVRAIVHSATYVLSPTASELETRGETGKLHAMLIAGSMYSVLLSWPVLAGLLVFGRGFLVTWVGPQYASASSLLAILAVPTLISLPQSAASALLFGVSRHKGVVTLSMLNALLNLGLSIWWVKPFGLTGVAMGTAIPLGLISGMAMMLYACHALEMPFSRYLWEGMGRPGLACLAFAIPALAVEWLWHPVGWVPLAAATGGCWAVFAWFAWRFGMNAGERERWLIMVPALFGRKPAAAGIAG
jgi:O-antigen/teichoic acid export membrane protein